MAKSRAKRSSASAAFAEEAEVQREIDRSDKKQKGRKQDGGAMQAGARLYPVPPLPGQHLQKPGEEGELELQPFYDAPHYKGSGKLEGMVALITGGDSGIGRSVAVLYAREGADVAIAYLNEHEDAEETKRAVEEEGRRCILISGDVADPEFCKDAVERTVDELGKLDILVNNAAFQEHVNSFEELTEEHFDRTIKTNLYGYFHMAKAAVPHMENGSAIVMTGSARK
jgi:short chain dehydrogenase